MEEVLDIVLDTGSVSVVGKLRQVVHGDNTKLTDLRKQVNLGIAQGILPFSSKYLVRNRSARIAWTRSSRGGWGRSLSVRSHDSRSSLSLRSSSRRRCWRKSHLFALDDEPPPISRSESKPEPEESSSSNQSKPRDMKRTPTGESLLSAGEELKKTTEPDRRARRDWATDLNYIAQSYLPLNKTSCLTGFGSSFSGSKKILQFNERSPGRNQKLTGPAIW